VELRFDDNIPADFDSMQVVVKVALKD